MTDWVNLDELWTELDLRDKSDANLLYYVVAQLDCQGDTHPECCGALRRWTRCVLLFLELLSSPEDVYKRIGVVSQRFPKHVVELLLKDQEEGAQFPCRELRDGLHTIRVV